MTPAKSAHHAGCGSRRRALRTLSLALVMPAFAPPSAAAAGGEVPIGGLLREAELRGLNGPPRKLSSFRGKPLVINVWASWCGPCREEAGSLERLAWGAMGSSFNVIGISTDDYADRALDWLRESHATLNHFIDHDLEIEHMLGASHLPLTVLVDPQGRVLDKVYGAQVWDGPEAAARLRRHFHLGSPPGATQRTGLRTAPIAPDLDQRPGPRPPV